MPEGLLSQRLPLHATRQGRVLLVGEVAERLSRGELPSVEARMFVASALLSWLANGGDLVRDHLRVSGRQGSHVTPAYMYRALLEERQADVNPENFGMAETEGDAQ